MSQFFFIMMIIAEASRGAKLMQYLAWKTDQRTQLLASQPLPSSFHIEGTTTPSTCIFTYKFMTDVALTMFNSPETMP